MRKILLASILLVLATIATAQPPVQWKITARKLSNKTYEIRLSAIMSDGWYIYTQFMDGQGPIPTNIKYQPNPSVDMSGKITEAGKLEQKYETAFGTEVGYYHSKVEFVQQVKVMGKLPVTLNGSVEFMGCNTKMCMPPQVKEFKVLLR